MVNGKIINMAFERRSKKKQMEEKMRRRRRRKGRRWKRRIERDGNIKGSKKRYCET